MGLSGVLRQPAGVMADCRFWRLYLAGTASSSSFTIVAGKKGSFRRLSAIGVVGQPCILTDFFFPSRVWRQKVVSKNTHHIRIALILVLKSDINYGLCEMD